LDRKQAVHLIHRIWLTVLGFLICTFGVVLSSNTNLGMAPCSSFPYVVSLLGERSLGFYTAAIYIVCVLLQILLLRRDFKPVNLLQIGSSTIFGFFVDMWEALLGGFMLPGYLGRLAVQMFSILAISLGATLYVDPELMPMPVEGFVMALSKKTGRPFGKLKVLIDCVFATCSCALSLLALGQLRGIREGTILTALLMGRGVSMFKKFLSPTIHRLCFGVQEFETVK